MVTQKQLLPGAPFVKNLESIHEDSVEGNIEKLVLQGEIQSDPSTDSISPAALTHLSS